MLNESAVFRINVIDLVMKYTQHFSSVGIFLWRGLNVNTKIISKLLRAKTKPNQILFS